MYVSTILNKIKPYLIGDSPISWLGLKIYPIKTRDYYKFIKSSDILQMEKNKTGDIKIIQMSYLQFLMQLVINIEEWKIKFINILELCFKIESNDEFLNIDFSHQDILCERKSEDISYIYINGYNVYFKVTGENDVELYINDVEINSTDFNELRHIILYQNIDGYSDEPVSDDVKKVVAEYYRLKNKNIAPIDIDDKVVSVMSVIGGKYTEMLDTSYRIIEKLFTSIVGRDEYKIGRLFQSQGSKTEVEHWAYKPNKERFADVFTDAETYKNKINQS